MDILQEKMQKTDFVWVFRNDISLEGKDKNGYYTVCVNGLENDDYDMACYSFKDYEKLKKFISSLFGEPYYDFLCKVYEKYGNEA